MENLYIDAIKATCLFGRFDLYHRFHSGINIIYGINGSGKTTLLHILTNVLQGNYWRFFYISFNEIEIYLSNQRIIKITRDESEKQIRISATIDNNPTPIFYSVVPKSFDNGSQEPNYPLENDSPFEKTFSLYFPNKAFVDEVERRRSLNQLKPLLPSVYLPAFRINIDLLSNSQKEFLSSEERNRSINDSLRSLYGQFLPDIQNLSVNEIQSRISEEIINTGYTTIYELTDQIFEPFNVDEVGNSSEKKINQSSIEKLEMFKYLTLLSGYPSENRKMSKDKINKIRKNIRGKRYSNIMKPIQNAIRFVEIINQFFEGKKLRIFTRSKNGNILGIEFEQNGSERGSDLNSIVFDMSALSSGERQLFTIAYSIIYRTQSSTKSSVILFDEPEISLNLEWQRNLLDALFSNTSDQIMVCTHSSALSVDFTRDEDTELIFSPTSYSIQFLSEEQLTESKFEDNRLDF